MKRKEKNKAELTLKNEMKQNEGRLQLDGVNTFIYLVELENISASAARAMSPLGIVL